MKDNCMTCGRSFERLTTGDQFCTDLCERVHSHKLRVIQSHSHPEAKEPKPNEKPWSRDQNVYDLRSMLLARSRTGFEKYGTTTDRQDIDLKGWLQHALEEALDQCVYLRAAIRKLEEMEAAAVTISDARAKFSEEQLDKAARELAAIGFRPMPQPEEPQP